MPFPPSSRYIYTKNPLIRVICQLRFPPILRIDSEIPSLFQERIQGHYPEYEEKKEHQREVAFDVNGKFDPESIRTKSSESKNHEFTSEDGAWRLNLTRNFLSISTPKYERWEGLTDCFQPALAALQEIYSPPFFTRLGLRYVDIFDRSILGESKTPWSELLNPNILGLVASDLAEEINNSETVNEVDLGNSNVVRIASRIVVNASNSRKCIEVDSDFHNTTRTKCEDAWGKLNNLHQFATDQIQWIIQPKLHTAMGPQKILSAG